MAKKQFKAESKKLLDLMINSIYTHKEIFLRELISNASDAIDKLYYTELTSGNTGVKKSDFGIEIIPDEDLRTLTIRDNGIGMTREELEANLGTIAKSGSQLFKEDDVDDDSKAGRMVSIIGQFGVGFYSAFMVADMVTVTSRAYGSDEANIWMSSGADGYTIEPAIKDSCGTEIVLHLKEDREGDNYSDYLKAYKLRGLVRKYSDYIRYPIRLETTDAESGDITTETLNSMEPIWKRQKSKVKPEDYNEYYKNKFNDYADPLRVIRTSVEGVSSYTALLFIPSHVPYDYYTKDFEKGLSLYSSGVMIMEHCGELIPDYFNFVKGLVDSQDLSLNISRETLQHDRQLANIAKNIEKKIKRELETFLKEDREGYEKFFAAFGRQLKIGLYDDFGANRDTLQDLVLFLSDDQGKLLTFDEYVSGMKEDQKYIYYASGETREKIDLLPQTAYVRSKGYDVLCLTDEIDEFAVRMLGEYKGKAFRSVTEEDMDADDESASKERIKKLEDENSDLLGFIKASLSGRVSDVRLSGRLSAAPAGLNTKGGISLGMEKVLNAMPDGAGFRAERVLELNPDHEVFNVLKEIYASIPKDQTEDKESKESDEAARLRLYADLLCDQAMMYSGLPIEDPSRVGDAITSLITAMK